MEEPTVNQTQTQESSQQESSQPLQNEQNELCRFCNLILYGGMDNNNLMHCQGCHRIWDGNAQCNCDFYND